MLLGWSPNNHSRPKSDRSFRLSTCGWGTNFSYIRLFTDANEDLGFDFDPEKDAVNLRKHGMSLAEAAHMEIEVALPDYRRDYGEPRWRAFGYINGLACCMAFTVRNGRVRVISLRRAHAKELKRYVKTRT